MAFFSKGQNSRGMRERAMKRKRTNGRKKRTPPGASEMDALDDERVAYTGAMVRTFGIRSASTLGGRRLAGTEYRYPCRQTLRLRHSYCLMVPPALQAGKVFG